MANTTWSPTDKSSGITLSNGNLTMTNSPGGNWGGRSVDSKTAGKQYWEVTCVSINDNGSGPGVSTGAAALNFVGTSYTGAAVLTRNFGLQYNNASSLGGFAAIANGNVVCVALDVDNRRVWFRVGAAGNWNANSSNNPATGVGGFSISTLGAVALFPCYATNNSPDQFTANFGDSAFSGVVPAGFDSGFGPPVISSAQARVAILA